MFLSPRYLLSYIYISLLYHMCAYIVDFFFFLIGHGHLTLCLLFEL